MARSKGALTESRCSIARTLEVVGEKWALLIVREAERGSTRFSEFRDALGVAPDILTDRLQTLVAYDVLERRPYQEAGARQRDSYHLTESGRDLRIVLGALQQWGNVHRPTEYGPAASYRRRDGDQPVRVAFIDADGAEVAPPDVRSVPGPGWFQN